MKMDISIIGAVDQLTHDERPTATSTNAWMHGAANAKFVKRTNVGFVPAFVRRVHSSNVILGGASEGEGVHGYPYV